MMRVRQTIAAILAALLLVPTLAACGEKDDVPSDTGADDTTETSAADTTTGEVTTAEPAPTLAFAKEDNNNRAIHIMAISEASYEYEGDSTGDRVASAVYDRNLAVEEYLGVTLDVRYESGSWANRNTYNNIVRQSIAANDGSIDYANGMISCIMPIVSTQYFTNLLELPNLDLDNDWWVSSMKTDTVINGKLMAVMGDLCLSMYKDLTAVIFNKNLIAADAELADPYTLVANNQWTLDTFLTQTAGHGKDLNGDGVWEGGVDLFNMVSEGNAWRSWNAALDIHSISLDDEGKPIVVQPDDKLLSAVERFQSYWDTNSDISLAGDTTMSLPTMFAAGQVIYSVWKLNLVETLADMPDDFGIVPMPKYDADQEEYYTPVAGASAIIVVPNTVSDPALVGKVLETVAFYSSDCVTAYYESALKERYSRDPETAGMLDLVRRGAYNGVDYLYQSTITVPSGALRSVTTNATVSPDQYVLHNETYNIASVFATYTRGMEKNIEKLLQSYADPET